MAFIMLVLQRRKLRLREFRYPLCYTLLPLCLTYRLKERKKEKICVNLGMSIYDVAFMYQSQRNRVNDIFRRVIGSCVAK